MKGFKAKRLDRYKRWLLRNRLYYGAYKETIYVPGMAQSTRDAVRREIVRVMKQDGVIAKSTYFKDVNLGRAVAAIDLDKITKGAR